VSPLERATAVCALLGGYRFSYTNEAELQQGIERVLVASGHAFRREKHISRKNRPDFLLEDGVAVEVKIEGSLTAVLRQLSRYAEQESISAIVFVTTRAVQAMRIPKEFCAKPVRVVLLAGVLG
jgi:hypothetical protein